MKAEINYDNDQVFLCQGCGRKYRHGDAKGNMAFADDNAVGHPYHPGVFCCAAHENDYLVKHKRYPAVGYEIPLGDWEPCNLGLIKASEGYVADPLTGRPLTKFYDEVVQMRIAGGKLGEANANKDVFAEEAVRKAFAGFITVDTVPFVAHDPRDTKAAPPSPPVGG